MRCRRSSRPGSSRRMSCASSSEVPFSRRHRRSSSSVGAARPRGRASTLSARRASGRGDWSQSRRGMRIRSRLPSNLRMIVTGSGQGGGRSSSSSGGGDGSSEGSTGVGVSAGVPKMTTVTGASARAGELTSERSVRSQADHLSIHVGVASGRAGGQRTGAHSAGEPGTVIASKWARGIQRAASSLEPGALEGVRNHAHPLLETSRSGALHMARGRRPRGWRTNRRGSEQ